MPSISNQTVRRSSIPAQSASTKGERVVYFLDEPLLCNVSQEEVPHFGRYGELFNDKCSKPQVEVKQLSDYYVKKENDWPDLQNPINHKNIYKYFEDCKVINSQPVNQSVDGNPCLIEKKVLEYEPESIYHKLKDYLGNKHIKYIGTHEGNCQNYKPEGHGHMRYANGYVYEGNFENGIPRGQGKMKYPNGNYYEGNFENGIPHGQGKMNYANGNYYEGNFDNGILQGDGKMNYANGNYYEGNFENDIPYGIGKITYPNGDCYEGELSQGIRRHGKGKMKSLEGYHKFRRERNEKDFLCYQMYSELPIFRIYDGDWKDDFEEGHGVVTYVRQTSQRDSKDPVVLDKYEGKWKDGAEYGYGVMTYSDGRKYEGGWKEGLRDGYGVMTYSDGRKYVGKWQNGKLHCDWGFMVCSNGHTFTGKWENGRLCDLRELNLDYNKIKIQILSDLIKGGCSIDIAKIILNHMFVDDNKFKDLLDFYEKFILNKQIALTDAMSDSNDVNNHNKIKKPNPDSMGIIIEDHENNTTIFLTIDYILRASKNYLLDKDGKKPAPWIYPKTGKDIRGAGYTIISLDEVPNVN